MHTIAELDCLVVKSPVPIQRTNTGKVLDAKAKQLPASPTRPAQLLDCNQQGPRLPLPGRNQIYPPLGTEHIWADNALLDCLGLACDSLSAYNGPTNTPGDSETNTKVYNYYICIIYLYFR